MPLQPVLDALDEGVVVLDPDNVILAVNHRVFEILRTDSSEEVVGKHLSDTIALHSDLVNLSDTELEKVIHFRIKLLSGGYHEGGDFTERSALRDGRTIELRRSVSIHGFATVTLRDVTAEEELERKRAQLETVVQHTDDGVFQIDGDGTIELFNTRMASMYHFDEAGIEIGDHVSKFVSFLIRRSRMDAMQLATFKCIDSNNSGLDQPLIREQIIETDWGDVFEVSRVRLPGGGAIATHRDVTARHQRQALLEQAKAEAEDASRLKSEFIARVTHELRTPMHGVLGLAALLERSGLNANQLRFLESLQRSGRHMVDLIDGLLTISTVEAGDLNLELDTLDIELLLQDCFEMLRPNARDKGLTFSLETELDVQKVIGDATRLTQIIVNLLANAIKFTEQGEVSLHASSVLCDRGVSVVVEISDTGIGIPEGKIETVFEKFTQVPGRRDVCHEGVGLGLSIASSLTELMGGRMRVQSEIDKGTVFTLELLLEPASRVASGGAMPLTVRDANP